MKKLTCYDIKSDYSIDENGNVWNTKRNKQMSANADKNGYLQIRLYQNDGKRGSFLIHRLVAFTYLETEIKETVNHIDGNKLNNHFSNLEWMTRLENTNDAKRLGYNGNYTDVSEELVLVVIQELEKGIAVKDICTNLNVSKNFVSRIRQDKRHKDVEKNIIQTQSKKYSLETKKDICYLILKGVQPKLIKEYFNLSKSYVGEVKNGRALIDVMNFVKENDYKPSETIENYFFSNK